MSIRPTAIIGHRGTGKTALLRRIETYFAAAGRPVECLDLDKEIERRSGQTIHSIFADQGEAAFRKIELETFAAIDREFRARARVGSEAGALSLFVACGAGFPPASIPESWKVLWVRRASDASGRIFTDRPRLNATVSALAEFEERYHRRQGAYAARADEALLLEEGLDAPDEIERDFFLDAFRDLGGALTILPDRFRTQACFEEWAQARVRWGVRWFELRDDLLTAEQMNLAVQMLPQEKVLVSFRRKQRESETRAFIERGGFAFDWPVENGPCPSGTPRFYSLHARGEGQSVREALRQMPQNIPSGVQLKAALPIRDFKDLAEAHAWLAEGASTSDRVFLPMSADGRWTWFRLLLGTGVDLNFFRESEGSGADQPTLLQWARRRQIESVSLPSLVSLHKNSVALRSFSLEYPFAAVLGDPVAHSRTPLEQAPYFQTRKASVFAIRITENEWQEGALDLLRNWGLRWAAVTSPLKDLAFKLCRDRDDKANALQAINTIEWMDDSQVWRGTNTDLEGFKEAVESVRSEMPLGRMAVWGGGGTLNVIRAVLPEAELFSLRTHENRRADGPSAEAFDPETLIWAVGRSRTGDGKENEPPQAWRPKVVIDLNYADDSPGREFAVERGCRYVSGLTMFRFQAAAQRRFWDSK